MSSSLSRRRFLTATMAAAGIGATLRPRSASAQTPIVLGTGRHRYEWVHAWGLLPGGKDYGNTHGGIIIDASERVYVNTDTTDAVLMFDTDGRFLGSWGKEFAGGLHGMTLVRECDREILYITHTGRHEVVKTTLNDLLHGVQNDWLRETNREARELLWQKALGLQEFIGVLRGLIETGKMAHLQLQHEAQLNGEKYDEAN